eukprot:Cvel_32708.t1-p1 / transcript=Cvel_32708.t1 / gene=Cvel_32708 / organism=Chromera_velia_CCMP2878 / gene_product=hypothetical protein / transcript_product=hypothetical protein / location=Cvel_scaffold5151:1-3446(-) / protein_length=429 / sequence_SO=supercontig / SO=protein_coding / is_pseudo=false
MARLAYVFAFITAVAFATGVSMKDATGATPLAKVLTMLGSMLSTSKKEIHEEQIAFSAFKQWCEDTSAEKGGLIEKGKVEVEELEAAVEKGLAEAAALAKEIEELSGMIEEWKAERKKTKAVREEEHAVFVAAHTDYLESIDALERAITVMKGAKTDLTKVAQAGEALLQTLKVKRSALNSGTLPQIVSLLEDIPAGEGKHFTKEGIYTDPEKVGYGGLDYKPPEAHAYEFKSNGVVDLLEKLLDKFTAEKVELEKQEADDLHTYKMVMADLKSSIEKAEQAIGSKTENKGKALEAANQAKTDLEETKATLASNEKYLTDLVSHCKTKNSEFQTRQKLREDEIAALSQAIDILTNIVQGHTEKYMPADVVKPTNSPVVPVLLQTGSTTSARSQSNSESESDGQRQTQSQVSQFLQKAASKLHSKLLDAL